MVTVPHPKHSSDMACNFILFSAMKITLKKEGVNAIAETEVHGAKQMNKAKLAKGKRCLNILQFHLLLHFENVWAPHRKSCTFIRNKCKSCDVRNRGKQSENKAEIRRRQGKTST
ncbi:hypothetical protein Trydic_g22949 [Trypoxylus dichotomus]